MKEGLLLQLVLIYTNVEGGVLYRESYNKEKLKF